MEPSFYQLAIIIGIVIRGRLHTPVGATSLLSIRSNFCPASTSHSSDFERYHEARLAGLPWKLMDLAPTAMIQTIAIC
jgi:hypothetical protein